MAWNVAMWWLCALLVLPTAAPALPAWGAASDYGIEGSIYRSDLMYSMLRPGRLRALYAFDGHLNSTAAGTAESELVNSMTAEIVGGGRYTNVAVEGMAYYMPGGDTYIEVRSVVADFVIHLIVAPHQISFCSSALASVQTMATVTTASHNLELHKPALAAPDIASAHLSLLHSFATSATATRRHDRLLWTCRRSHILS